MIKIMPKIKYPKFCLLLLSFIVAYALFYEKDFTPLHTFLISAGYWGYILAGGFYAYGFTAAPATAVLLSIAKDGNLILAALIGGIGALIGDLIIFLFIKYSFSEEIKRASKEKLIKFVVKEERKIFGNHQKYVLASFAGFLIASPLPTEIGVTLMATLKDMSIKKFMIIAYLLHSAGIFLILLIGSAL